MHSFILKKVLSHLASLQISGHLLVVFLHTIITIRVGIVANLEVVGRSVHGS